MASVVVALVVVAAADVLIAAPEGSGWRSTDWRAWLPAVPGETDWAAGVQPAVRTVADVIGGMPERSVAPGWLVALIGGWVFVLGACWGSFLNVVAYRLPRGESLVRGGSRCPACKQAIAPYDNVPILGWVWLGGRCRNCRTRVAIRYPLVELLTAISFLLAAQVAGLQQTANWLVTDLDGPAGRIAVWWLAVAVWICVVVAVGLMELDGVVATRRARRLVWGLLLGVAVCVGYGAMRPDEEVATVVVASSLLGGMLGCIAGWGIERWRRRRGASTGWCTAVWGATGLIGGPIMAVAVAALGVLMVGLACLWQRSGPNHRTAESGVLVALVAGLACWLWLS